MGLRHRQALAALGAAALQDQASVLGAHSLEETVRPAPAAAIGLKSALHGITSLTVTADGRTAEPQMVAVGPVRVNRGTLFGLWYRPPLPVARTNVPLRSNRGPSRFSTIVENSVEISGLSGGVRPKMLVVVDSAYGEGVNDADFARVFGLFA